MQDTEVNYAFSPTVDGYFIEKFPEELLKANDFNHIDILAGMAQDEVSDEYCK